MNEDTNVKKSPVQKRKRSLLVFEDSSSDSSVGNVPQRRRKIYIQESDSESDSDSSYEFNRRKKVTVSNVNFNLEYCSFYFQYIKKDTFF